MKVLPAFTIFSALAILGCSDHGVDPDALPHQIFLDCIDRVPTGDLEVVVESQSQYEQLIFLRFTKPLQDYWNAHYDSTLARIKRRYPGLTDQQYADSVRKIFYSQYPFKGTENCSHPTIDFSKHTLLGQKTFAAGCRAPDYSVTVSKNDNLRVLTFNVVVVQHGACEMSWEKNIWFLIPKLPSDYVVKFERQYHRDWTTSP